MGSFVDPSARCETADIGDGTHVLAYARVGPDVAIGSNCAVGDYAMVVGDVILEDDVTIHPGAQVLGRVRIEQGASIGPGAVVGAAAGEVAVNRFAAVGANATVLPGVAIGRRAVVEPGSVVTDSVPANAVVSGNPARIVSYLDSGHEAGEREIVAASVAASGVAETRVGGVTLHPLAHARDLRGSLTATEFSTLPFEPRRLFTVFDVPSESVRGSHAHRECAQFLVCTVGEVSCLVDDGTAREEIRLGSPGVGLYIPPLIWGAQWRYSHDALLLVLASHPYDAGDYIRDYEEFLAALGRDNGP